MKLARIASIVRELNDADVPLLVVAELRTIHPEVSDD